MMLVIYMQAFLKLVYLDWRPVFLSIQLNSSACEPDYGRPSGHALTSAIMVILTLVLMFKPKILWLKVVFYVISFVLVVIICFSRLYLGKHSVNQLVLGFCIGAFLYILFFYVVDEWVKERFLKPLVFNLVEEETNQIRQKKKELKLPENEENQTVKSDKKILLPSSKEINDKAFKRAMVVNLVLFIVSNILIILGCILAKIRVEFPGSEFFAQFRNCFSLRSMYDSEFSSKIIRDGGLFNVYFGLVLGTYINHQKHMKSRKLGNSESTSFRNPFQGLQLIYDRNCKFIMVRLAVMLLCMLPLALMFFVSGLIDGVGAVVLNIILGLFLPFVVGLLLALFYIFLLEKCNVPYFQRQIYNLVEKKIHINNI